MHREINKNSNQSSAENKNASQAALFYQISASSFALAVVVSLFEILARYLFNSPTIWAHETVIALVASGYLIGGLFALHNNKHISMTILYDRLNPIQKNICELFSYFIAVVFFAVCAYASFKLFLNSVYSPSGYFRLEGTGSAWNPPLPAMVKGLMFATFSIMTCFSGWRFIKCMPSSIEKTQLTIFFQNGKLFSTFIGIVLCVCILIAFGSKIPLGLTSLLCILLILLLALVKVPLAIVTGCVGVLVTLCWFGLDVSPLVTSRVYSFINEYVLVAVPMFVLMAAIMDRSNIAQDLYNVLSILFRRLPGGIAIQTLITGLFLAAISGIIGGEIVLLGLIALPQMLRLGYNKRLAIGTVCASGSLGTMIPPSIVLIVYGLTAGVAIGDLFIATIIPGLILASMYIVYIFSLCLLKRELAPPRSNEQTEKLNAKTVLRSLGYPSLIVASVLGSIYGGIASVTEAACLGVVMTSLVCVVRGEMRFDLIRKSLLQTLESCGIIIWIGVGASILVGVYNLIGGNIFIRELITELDVAPIVIILAMMGILLVLGLFMDWIGIALLTMPIFVPIVIELGFSPIWFGILFSVNMQVSYLSPPFGPAAFYLKSVAPSSISLTDIYASVWPFIILQILLLFLLLCFPNIALWLPEVVSG